MKFRPAVFYCYWYKDWYGWLCALALYQLTANAASLKQRLLHTSLLYMQAGRAR